MLWMLLLGSHGRIGDLYFDLGKSWSLSRIWQQILVLNGQGHIQLYLLEINVCLESKFNQNARKTSTKLLNLKF